jgi:hypothetical protein
MTNITGITTLQQAFEQFERNSVRVPAHEIDAAKMVQKKLRATVEEALGELCIRTFRAGSYRRRTQAVHLKDLDIIVVLDDPTGELRRSPNTALSLMKRVGLTCHLVSGAMTKCRAVECELLGYPFWADLVPALDDGTSGLLLAYVDHKEGIEEWRFADPEGQTVACQEKNTETGDLYVPVTRICKYWNGSFTSSPKQEKPLPSYLAEAILHDAVSSPTEWAHAALAFFENAQHHLSLQEPSVPCPGASNDFVDEKLEDQRRLRALGLVEGALVHARTAVQASDEDERLDAWARVFGPAFPAPSTDPSRVTKAIRTGRATLVGPGVSPTSEGRRPIPARSHGVAGQQS